MSAVILEEAGKALAYKIADTVLTMVQTGFNADEVRDAFKAKLDAGLSAEAAIDEIARMRKTEEELTRQEIDKQLGGQP